MNQGYGLNDQVLRFLAASAFQATEEFRFALLIPVGASVPVRHDTNIIVRPLVRHPPHGDHLVDLARLHDLTTRHARHVFEAVSTPAIDDPTVLAAYQLLARLEPTACPPLDDIRVGPAFGEGACYRGLIVINPGGVYTSGAICCDWRW